MQASLSSVGIPWSLSVPSGINCITNDEHIHFQNPPRKVSYPRRNFHMYTPTSPELEGSSSRPVGPMVGRTGHHPETKSSRDQGET